MTIPVHLRPGARVSIVDGEVIDVDHSALGAVTSVYVQLDSEQEVRIPVEAIRSPRDATAQLRIAIDALRELAEVPILGRNLTTALDKSIIRARDALAEIAAVAQPLDVDDVRDGGIYERVETVTTVGRAHLFDGDTLPILASDRPATHTTVWRAVEPAITEQETS